MRSVVTQGTSGVQGDQTRSARRVCGTDGNADEYRTDKAQLVNTSRVKQVTLKGEGG
jgi:hypothetical protein